MICLAFARLFFCFGGLLLLFFLGGATHCPFHGTAYRVTIQLRAVSMFSRVLCPVACVTVRQNATNVLVALLVALHVSHVLFLTCIFIVLLGTDVLLGLCYFRLSRVMSLVLETVSPCFVPCRLPRAACCTYMYCVCCTLRRSTGRPGGLGQGNRGSGASGTSAQAHRQGLCVLHLLYQRRGHDPGHLRPHAVLLLVSVRECLYVIQDSFDL